VNHGGPLIAAAMSLTPTVESFAAIYLSIIGWMVALWGCRTIYQTILNIYGEPKWNTLSNVVFFMVNLLGNAVAVYGFMGIAPSGVAGVAVASVVAALASLLVLVLIVHLRLKIRLPFVEGFTQFPHLIKPVLRIAAPSILEPMSFQAYMISLNWIAASVSDLALKVKIYAYNTFLFCLMISIALSMATEAIIAQRIGRKEFDIADQQLWRSLKVALLGTGIMAVAWLVFNQPILALFTSDAAVLAIGFWVFLWSLLAEPARTTNIMIGSALRSTGDATFTSVSSIVVIWLFSIPLAYALAIYFHWGIYGLLAAAFVDETIRALIKRWRWRQRKWENYGVALWEARQLVRRK
jgi:Na+-driven multidrug efflux pump